MKLLLTKPVGRIGNNLFQLYFANYLESKLENFETAVFGIPEFGIPESPKYGSYGAFEPDVTLTGHEISENEIKKLNSSEAIVVQSQIIGMRQEFLAVPSGELQNFSLRLRNCNDDRLRLKSKYVLCHVRNGDIWANNNKFSVHPNYPALPLDYYKEVREYSGKNLKFIFEPGTTNWYKKMLLEYFGKDAEIDARSALADFSLISAFDEVALSVSSFSWMAAYLGKVSRVHYPVAGIFDMNVRPDIELAVGLSGRVQHYYFEENKWHGNFRNLRWIEKSKVKTINN